MVFMQMVLISPVCAGVATLFFETLLVLCGLSKAVAFCGMVNAASFTCGWLPKLKVVRF